MLSASRACLLGPLLLLAAVGCGPAEQQVEVAFRARAGTAALACGTPVEGAGTTGTSYELKDLRFYVYEVRLVAGDGTEVPVALTEDGVFQGQGVALLDLEDGTGACQNGNAELHAKVEGTVPSGDYQGLRFVLGVPEALNHADASLAGPPLNFTSLFWSWKAGYKFLRMDGETTGQPTGVNFHLGSNACDGDPVTCSEPNRVEVSLPDFRPGEHAVAADAFALFEGANLDENSGNTPPGCMGAPSDDPDCEIPFRNLGLGPDGGDQAFFRVEAL